MKKALISIILILTITLIGCGCNDINNEYDENYNYITDCQLAKAALLQPFAKCNVTKCETGYYALASKILYYIEGSTMRTTPLCNKPNCMHNNESCNAYVGVVDDIFYSDGYIYYMENIISYICVFLNVIFIIPNALNNIVVQFLQKVSVIINVPTAEMIGNKQIDLIIIILLNITFTVSNIIGISKHEEKCKNIYEIGSALLGENEYKDISKVYDNEFKKHKINNVIIARGRFTYSSQYISNHKNTIEDIPLKYRMWFIDKEQANIPRLKITVILSFFAVCMLLLQFQCSAFIFVANIFAHVLAYIVTRIFILSRIGKRNIIKNM